MDNNKSDYYKNKLSSKKEDKERLINKMKESTIEAANELSNYDNHPGDLGSEVYEKEHNEALKNNQKLKLKEIEEALKNIDTDRYGICKECGKEISEERLEIIPETHLCINCANEKSETNRVRNSDPDLKRPTEEKAISAPLGRKYLNKQEDDEHEGMDQFHDVEKYGSSDGPQDMGGYKDYKDFYTNKKDRQGEVEDTDNISNKYYESQLD